MKRKCVQCEIKETSFEGGSMTEWKPQVGDEVLWDKFADVHTVRWVGKVESCVEDSAGNLYTPNNASLRPLPPKTITVSVELTEDELEWVSRWIRFTKVTMTSNDTARDKFITACRAAKEEA